MTCRSCVYSLYSKEIHNYYLNVASSFIPKKLRAGFYCERAASWTPGARWELCAAAAAVTQLEPVDVKRWQDAGGEQPTAHRAQWSVSAAARTTLDYHSSGVSMFPLCIPAACVAAGDSWSTFVFFLPWHIISDLLLLLCNAKRCSLNEFLMKRCVPWCQISALDSLQVLVRLHFWLD